MNLEGTKLVVSQKTKMSEDEFAWYAMGLFQSREDSDLTEDIEEADMVTEAMIGGTIATIITGAVVVMVHLLPFLKVIDVQALIFGG
ncbi:MAG: hypothetical protein HQ536_02885 [Parcubacteria group bacterium]|nr:hypothetical protein [Parcubacteria group bacterium]